MLSALSTSALCSINRQLNLRFFRPPALKEKDRRKRNPNQAYSYYFAV